MQQPPRPKLHEQVRHGPPLKPPRKLSEAEWKKFVKNWVAHKKKIYEAYEKGHS
jgi:hypothetical protein